MRSGCPTSYSELHQADSWIQATDATSDYFVEAPACDDTWWRNGIDASIGAMPQPAPDGSAFVGGGNQPGYVEYVGACLLSPLQAGELHAIAELSMDGVGVC